MAGKSPSRAVSNFIRPLRKVFSFLTKTALRFTKETGPTGLHVLMLGDAKRIPLRSDDGEVEISIIMHYQVVEADGDKGPWKVKTVGYMYQLYINGKEEALYHYHPNATPHIPFPHVHMGQDPRLSRKHMPTGRVSIEAFIRCLIEEYAVKPTPGWEAALYDTQKRFERHRTWA